MRAATLCLALILLTAGCAEPATQVAAQHHHGVAATFSATDAGWLQLMIPMDEQALKLLALVPSRSKNPALVALAAALATAHRAELGRLRDLRTRMALGDTNPHEGHTMPGMLNADGLQTVARNSGPAFDALFRTHLKAHLDQSAQVSRSEETAGGHPSARTLAAALTKSRADQLTALGRLD
ncbi:MAG: DUF305 domain-containing protein [Streptosporangiaceae bacterium]